MREQAKASAVGALLALAIACSSYKANDPPGNDNNGNGNGAGTGGGGSILDPGAQDGSTQLSDSGSPQSEGGIVTISPETLEEVRNGSCAAWNAEPEPITAVLMFVVDASSSMNFTTPATGGQSKWVVTQAALLEAIAALPASASAGLLLYPNQYVPTPGVAPRDVSACINVGAMVPLAPLGGPDDAHRAAVNNAIQTGAPNRCTPTHDAYTVALADFQRANVMGDRFIVLITDGAPTLTLGCVGDCTYTYLLNQGLAPEVPIIDEIRAAGQSGVRTFVIGSPGSEGAVETGGDLRWWLSQAAEAGGTVRGDCSHTGEPYCHFDMTVEPDFGAALRATLSQIAGQVVRCNYELPPAPSGEFLDPDHVNVVLTPGGGEPLLVSRNDAARCDVGWQYSADGQQVLLCGQLCDQVKADPLAQIELHFGCATVVQ